MGSNARKVIVLLLFSILFIFTGAAQSAPDVDMDNFLYLDASESTYVLPGGQVDRYYRSYFDFSIPCNGNCPKNTNNPLNPFDTVGQRIELCGERVKVVRKDSPVNGVNFLYEPKNLDISSYPSGLPIINGPGSNDKSISCPPGKIGPMKFYYWGGNSYNYADEGGEITLYPHDEADYISVLAEEDPIENVLPGIDKPPQLYRFKLDKDGPNDIPQSDRQPGDILLMDLNPADNVLDSFNLQILQGDWNPLSETISVDFQAKQMKTGTVLNADTSMFNSVLRNPFELGEDCVEGDDEPCNTAFSDFETNKCVKDPYSGAACGPDCALAHAQENYCSGGYTPEETEKLFGVTSSVILGWRYPQLGDTMCPDGYHAGEDCDKYTEKPLKDGPPTKSQLETKSFLVGGKWIVDNDWSEPLKFHSCGQNLDLLEGKTVYSPSSNGPNQFRCDPDTGNWKQVTICNDGVDNDKDGKVDGPNSWYQTNDIGDKPVDPECLGDGESEYDSNCYGAVVGYNSTGGKNAFYQLNPNGPYSPQGIDCNYDKRQEDYGYGWAPSGGGTVNGEDLSHKYTCDTNTGEIKDNPNVVGDPPIYTKSDLEKDNIAVKYLYFAQQACQDTAAFDTHGDEMLASISQVPKKYIPLGPEFAGKGGFQPFITQTVRQAENKYFDTTTPSRSDLESRGIDPSDTQPYDDPKNNDLSPTWTSANYLAPFNDKVEGVNLLGTDAQPKENIPIFEGGLAGKCPGGEVWSKRGNKWECQNLENYAYILPDVKENIDDVGVKVLGKSIAAIDQTYSQDLQEVRAECWKGGETEGPAFMAWEDLTSISGPPYPAFITLKDPNVDTLDPGDYSCNFTVKTDGGDVIANDQSDWSNWWDQKSGMETVSQKVQQIGESRGWDQDECLKNFQVPCSTFKNLSVMSGTVKDTFFNKKNLPAEEAESEVKQYIQSFEGTGGIVN